MEAHQGRLELRADVHGPRQGAGHEQSGQRRSHSRTGHAEFRKAPDAVDEQVIQTNIQSVANKGNARGHAGVAAAFGKLLVGHEQHQRKERKTNHIHVAGSRLHHFLGLSQQSSGRRHGKGQKSQGQSQYGVDPKRVFEQSARLLVLAPAGSPRHQRRQPIRYTNPQDQGKGQKAVGKRNRRQRHGAQLPHHDAVCHPRSNVANLAHHHGECQRQIQLPVGKRRRF